jgi:hypothetical protein
MAGRVVAISAGIGDTVQAGQIVIEIAPPDLTTPLSAINLIRRGDAVLRITDRLRKDQIGGRAAYRRATRPQPQLQDALQPIANRKPRTSLRCAKCTKLIPLSLTPPVLSHLLIEDRPDGKGVSVGRQRA